MNIFKVLIFMLVINTVGSVFEVAAQDKKKKPRKWTLNGYINDLRTFIPVNGADSLVMDNLLHHRLNFKWYTSKSLTTTIEMRNRIFYGEVVRSYNNFGDLIDSKDEFLDMSWLLVSERSVVIHSTIDRGYINWVRKKADIRLGRQRINWGINLVWNPNDLFNNFSWFDFDYEERPGTDGLRIQYYTGINSSIEVAVKAVEELDELIAAALWKFNKKKYDFQLLGGVAGKDVALGGGWAGNIKKAGFKGEVTYFHPYDNPSDTEGVVALTISSDYSFKNSLYLHGSVLYNSNGASSATIEELLVSEISAKNLFPYEYTFFGQLSYPLTPLINGGLAAIYSPGDNILFVNPTLSFSIKDNFDFDLIGQIFYSDVNGPYVLMGEFFFTRLKWSY